MVTLLLTTARQHYLAITTHFIALSQALLLGGTRGLPGLNEVTQCDVHRPISLQFACRVITRRDEMTRNLIWRCTDGLYLFERVLCGMVKVVPVMRYSLPLVSRVTPHTAEEGAV